MNGSADLRHAPGRPSGARAGRVAKPARRTSWGLWLAVVALLTVALAASLGAPPLAAAAIRLALVRSLGTSDVAVTVEASPAPAVWWGNIGMLSVAARSVRIGRLEVAAFDAMLLHVVVDPGRLYGQRELTVRSVGSGVARVTVTANDLARLVETQPSVKQVMVRLTPGMIMLDGTMSAFGADFPASVAGHLVVRDATHLDLVIDRFTVLAGVPVPPDVASGLAASINPILDVGRLPFGLRLTDVTIGQSALVLRAAAGRSPGAAGTP